MGLKVIGMIPARYGSSRFPGKPLVQIAGKSLIQRTFENARRCRVLEDLIVATDDARIYDHVLGFGGKAVMTSEACPTGTERIAEAVRRNGDYDGVELVVNVQGDEPALEPEVVEKVVAKLREDAGAVMSTAVMKIRSEEEAASYSVNKCVMDVHGNALYFSRTLIPNGHRGKWQPQVTYYKHLGIYCYRKSFLLQYPELEPTPLQLAEDLEQLKVLEHGFRIKAAIVESNSIGVDTPEDIKKVERLL